MRVLVVDDDADIRQTIQRILEFEHIESVAAENSLSARRLLEEDVFTVVITDVN